MTEMNENCVIKIENLSKEYRLGAIGSGTLRHDLQSWYAKKRGKEDPNQRIGAKQYTKDDTFLALDGVIDSCTTIANILTSELHIISIKNRTVYNTSSSSVNCTTIFIDIIVFEIHIIYY